MRDGRGAGTGMKPQDNVESVIRGPAVPIRCSQAGALSLMEAAQVWPTPLNFELLAACGRMILRATSPHEVERLHRRRAAGITEDMSEELAGRYLPKQRLNEEIRDTGDQLSRELSAVSDAIHAWPKSKTTKSMACTLASADADFDAASADPEAMRATVGRLANATRTVHEAEFSS